MDKFENISTAGNEKAIRRGVRVPDGDVNLAWIKAPKMTPDKNIVVIDTSNTVAENTNGELEDCKLMYANDLGILEDAFGNEAIFQEYPAVGDVFSVDEDFSVSPGNEYTPESILPFVHISRYFHIDFKGYSSYDTIKRLTVSNVKVVDNTGKDYVDKNGKPRYRIALAAAIENEGSPQTAYRVYAFVDADKNENLYLKYNRVDVSTNGTFKNQNINYQEILNPRPYFKYVPEETEVFDPARRNEKIFTTKPTNAKQQILGIKTSQADGYKVHVPKKAVHDPRLFQLFRWRISCGFVEKITIDPAVTREAIGCGSVSTNWANPYYDAGTRPLAPFPFYDLEVSDYNAANLSFVNPITEKLNTVDPTTAIEKSDARYWNVNFETVTHEQLKEFDILVWYPETHEFDFTPYLGKIEYFTRQLGGTLVIECGGRALPKGLGCTFTSFVNPVSGSVNWPGVSDNFVLMDTLSPIDTTDIFFDADDQLGGWDFNDGDNDEYNSLHPALVGVMPVWGAPLTRGKMNYIASKPTAYETILRAKDGNDIYHDKMIRKTFSSGGSIVIDTCDIFTNYLADPSTGQLLSYNLGDNIYAASTPEVYAGITSAWAQEGAYKLMYNISLYGVSGKVLDEGSEFTLSTNFKFSSPWYSSWVINNTTADGKDDVLSQSEIDANQFVEKAKSRTDPTVVWQRRLEIPDIDGRRVPKTFKQLIDEHMTEEELLKVANATRTYSIEVTNSVVGHIGSVDIDEDDIPHAWTSTYTPKFTVPREIGAYVVREKLTPGEYVKGQFVHKEYPPKPYGVRVDVQYTATEQDTTVETINWTATGTATETILVLDQRRESWADAGSGDTWSGLQPFDLGTDHPLGIDLYSASNYYAVHSNHNYPSYGAYFRLGYGSWGRIVYWMQTAVNFFKFWGYLTGSPIVADGYWGPQTQDAVYGMQGEFGALEIDGYLDAELLSIMGYRILRMQKDHKALLGTYVQDWEYPASIPDNAVASSNATFFENPLNQMARRNISDNTSSTYSHRSNVGGSNTPSYIWDVVQITLARQTKIWGFEIIPHVERNAGKFGGNIIVEAAAVLDSASLHQISPADGHNYWNTPTWNPYIDSAVHELPMHFLDIPINQRVWHGQAREFYFSGYYGDTLLIKIGQDTPTEVGKALQMGIADLKLLTDSSFFARTTINLSTSGTVDCPTGKDILINVRPEYTGSGILSDINWSGVTLNPTGTVYSHFTSDGSLVLRNLRVENTIDQFYSSGPYLGRRAASSVDSPGAQGGQPTTTGVFYSRDETEFFNTVPESGWINKADGLKLFCDADGLPYGFPTMPTDIGQHEWQRHYVNISLAILDTDPEVMVGFYDTNKQEFILSEEGKPEMTYIEWVSRGPRNVFIAAVTDHEVAKKVDISSDGAPPLPYRIAMPVYGICTKPGSHIKVEYLPDNLGVFDQWPIPIRTGSFTRSVSLPTVTQKPTVSSWLNQYAGTTVKAFYAVPEAKDAGWSVIYGRPHIDVKDETPILLTDHSIQVRQPPLHAVQVPTVFSQAGNASDPVRPVFVVSTRASTASDWVELEWEDIRDYNLSTGEIEFFVPLSSSDPALVKVDYTTSRSVYNLKQVGGSPINLNPYPGHDRSLIGKAIYIYVLPEYVKDEDNSIISSSVRTSTINWTLDPSVFNPINPDYDPLAVQLAVIFITNSLDIDDLHILDTRRRGGGARDSAKLGELSRLVNESSSYWDISYAAGMTHQKGGFVLIRLPSALKNNFPNAEDIIDTIRRNITAGVQFKIEDLQGREW